MIIEISAVVIAIFSFLLSVYVIARDRKDKNLENLLLSRQRILDALASEVKATADEQIAYEDNPDSDAAKKYREDSQRVTLKVDTELEFACYLVIKKHIDFQTFFDLFYRWLAMREIHWDTIATYKKTNLPYTWQVINKCQKKGILPLKKK